MWMIRYKISKQWLLRIRGADFFTKRGRQEQDEINPPGVNNLGERPQEEPTDEIKICILGFPGGASG